MVVIARSNGIESYLYFVRIKQHMYIAVVTCFVNLLSWLGVGLVGLLYLDNLRLQVKHNLIKI